MSDAFSEVFGLVDVQVDTATLRERVALLPAERVSIVLSVWSACGLPAARTPEGDSVLLEDAVHREICSIVRGQEELCSVDDREVLQHRIGVLTDNERRWLTLQAVSHGVSHLGNMMLSTGEAFVLNRLIDEVMAERKNEVPMPPLPPLGDPDVPGFIVDTPVASAEVLALTPPVGTVDVVLSWVGGDAARAAAALDAEYAGKNRKTLVNQLGPLVEHGAIPEPAFALTTQTWDAAREAYVSTVDVSYVNSNHTDTNPVVLIAEESEQPPATDIFDLLQTTIDNITAANELLVATLESITNAQEGNQQ